jgi:three-Cys-motif partner protein
VVSKSYDWVNGVHLDDHTRRKHKILREYFYQYLIVRCANPIQPKFRLAVVDGFSGGGRYVCGSPGSPIIFIEELQRAINDVNANRASQELNSRLEIECLLILNDADTEVIDALKSYMNAAIANCEEICPTLELKIIYLNDKFIKSYASIKNLIISGRYSNVLFNLDQYGYSAVDHIMLCDITKSTPSAEVFYTFSIESLLAFLSRTDQKLLKAQLKPLGASIGDLQANGLMSNNAFLGMAERIVFDTFKAAARFVSPFSIRNPDGWRYWLIHLANNHRARQVYNDVLHGNGTQAHFGRSGLNMLSYDPSQGGNILYLFEQPDRRSAQEQLINDIPQFVSEVGNAMRVSDFYEAAYNITPAHKDDIHSALIENSELEIYTKDGGRRRKGNTINIRDTIKLKPQRSFFTFSAFLGKIIR